MNKIGIVHYEDWVGIYKNNHLVIEDHSLTPEELLEVIGIEFETGWIEDSNVIQSFKLRAPKTFNEAKKHFEQ